MKNTNKPTKDDTVAALREMAERLLKIATDLQFAEDPHDRYVLAVLCDSENRGAVNVCHLSHAQREFVIRSLTETLAGIDDNIMKEVTKKLLTIKLMKEAENNPQNIAQQISKLAGGIK